MQCVEIQALVQKLTKKIQSWEARYLSYAGRVYLIQSVLCSIMRFWCSILFIPNMVLEKIQRICRDYLWNGNSKTKHYPVAWHLVCRPKEQRRLNFKELLLWNKSLLSQYLGILQSSFATAGHLWAKWMWKYRVIGSSIWESTSRPTNSSFWKALVRLKDEIRRLAPTTGMALTPVSLYKLLNVSSVEVHWHHWVWPRTSIPKVSFICWIAVQRKLYIMDQVARFVGSVDTTCCLCNDGEESHEHLFFRCSYAKEVLTKIMKAVDYTIAYNLPIWNERFATAKIKNELFDLHAIALGVVVYHIWLSCYSRKFHCNNRKFQGKIWDINCCYFTAFTMLKNCWRNIQVKGNRYIKSIGDKLEIKW